MFARDPTLGPGSEPSRERRRLRREALERRERWIADREAFLETQLEPGEVVVAKSRHQPLVTERRILMPHQLQLPPRRGEWVCSSLQFAEITRWSPGRRHDHRPLLRLEHAPSARIAYVPAHHLLWFAWGNAEDPVMHTTTTFGFSRDGDPVLVAIRERLEQANVPSEDPFVIRPAGTREQRLGSSIAYLRTSPVRQARFTVRKAAHELYRGQLSWAVRIASWLVVAVPAWFVEPWLVLPAIALAEVAWIVGLQWLWRRDRDRRGG